MKKSWLFLLAFIVSACYKKTANKLHFAISPEYPPFEYKVDGELKGFDVELAQMIAKELGKEADFNEMAFSSILAAVQNGMADAGISTITITEERKRNFDFSTPYYQEIMVVVFSNSMPIEDREALKGKKIVCQLGTTMEMWLKKYAPQTTVVAMDHTPQAIEALKSGQAEGVLIDLAQGVEFCRKNKGLGYAVIARSEEGYGIILKKNSSLTDRINKALKRLEAQGVIQQLMKKYWGG